ncbi:MAG: SDR family oxidoreductase [Pseudomonadota bacterium]
MYRAVIFGATSAVAEQICRIYAQDKARLLLIGRREEALKEMCDDLSIRGAVQADYLVSDLSDLSQHQTLLERIQTSINEPNLFIFANGTLPDQQECEESVDKTIEAINQNALCQISLLTMIGNTLEKRKTGSIAVISSVAGDRGRMSNYVYGCAKGMLTRFLQGLRHRLSKSGVNVLDIKPGFIDTPMTAHIEPKGALWAKPEKVAQDIVKAIDSKRSVIYTPWFWRWIMLIIVSVPDFIFKKTKL